MAFWTSSAYLCSEMAGQVVIVGAGGDRSGSTDVGRDAMVQRSAVARKKSGEEKLEEKRIDKKKRGGRGHLLSSSDDSDASEG